MIKPKISLERILFIISLSVLISACKTPLQLPQDLSYQKTVFLPFRIDSIRIVDLRTDTISSDLKIPLLATKYKEWLARPTLKTELKNEIIKMINNSSNPDGLPVNVIFSISEGYYKISGNAMQVGEYTLFECSINFESIEPGNKWTTSAQASNSYVGIFNATEEHAREMYRITTRNSVFKALKQGESIFENDKN